MHFNVFHRNHEELQDWIAVKTLPEVAFDLWTRETRFDLQAVILEVIRRLHNFLAASKTLVDTTRAVIRRSYPRSQVLRDYEAEVQARFTTDELVQFVHALRNNATHQGLPVMMTSLSWRTDAETQEEVMTSEFYFERAALSAQSRDWNARARVYLAGADGSTKYWGLPGERWAVPPRRVWAGQPKSVQIGGHRLH
jgi:hypothetical protein